MSYVYHIRVGSFILACNALKLLLTDLVEANQRYKQKRCQERRLINQKCIRKV